MKLQKDISKEILEKNIGKTYEMLVESTSFDNKYYVGRTYMDVPEEDGVMFAKKTKEVELGKFVKCKVTDIRNYDMIGEMYN